MLVRLCLILVSQINQAIPSIEYHFIPLNDPLINIVVAHIEAPLNEIETFIKQTIHNLEAVLASWVIL